MKRNGGYKKSCGVVHGEHLKDYNNVAQTVDANLTEWLKLSGMCADDLFEKVNGTLCYINHDADNVGNVSIRVSSADGVEIGVPILYDAKSGVDVKTYYADAILMLFSVAQRSGNVHFLNEVRKMAKNVIDETGLAVL